MAKNVIVAIGDGMGWEMTRAAAIQAEIEAEIAEIRQENSDFTAEEIAANFNGRTLDDYYTEGKGFGTSYQNLEKYTIATTSNTYIDGDKTNSALQGTPFAHNTGQSEVREGFKFDPEAAVVKGFETDAEQSVSEAPVLDADGNSVGGNVLIFDLKQGGQTPWDANYYQNRQNPTEGFAKDYIKNLYPDSAGTATGLYAGVKTYVGAISVDIYEEEVKTAADAALKNGKSVGVVSSVPFNHATPAAAIAHTNHRYKYHQQSFDLRAGNGDGNTSNELDEFGHIIENRDNIFYQIVNEAKPTVILGGGHYLMAEGTELAPVENYITKAEIENLRQGVYDYTFVERGENASQVLAKTASKIDPEAGERLFGIYGARGQGGNLPWRTANDDYSRVGLGSRVDSTTGLITIDEKRPLAPGETDAAFIRRELNENPTLADLTSAALEVLAKDEDGFWLTVEGGDIDWAAHGNDIDNLLGTMKDFDESVATVKAWIDKHGGYRDNLLIVTADHDHYLTLTEKFPELLAKALLTDKGGEQLTTGDVLKTGHFWGSNESIKNDWATHTSRPVPVYYQGADARLIDKFAGSGYDAYNTTVEGVGNYIDQVHLGEAQIKAIATPVTASKPQPFLGLTEISIAIVFLLLIYVIWLGLKKLVRNFR